MKQRLRLLPAALALALFGSGFILSSAHAQTAQALTTPEKFFGHVIAKKAAAVSVKYGAGRVVLLRLPRSEPRPDARHLQARLQRPPERPSGEMTPT